MPLFIALQTSFFVRIVAFLPKFHYQCVRFVVGKVALKVSSHSYFCFLCQSLFCHCSTLIHLGAVALTPQHVVRSSAFKMHASSLTSISLNPK